MRITGGIARGISLAVPRGDTVRPATDATRQSVFSSIASWIPDARFLDLFAGSGAYGLEAVSRGAKAGVFIEKNAGAIACIRANMAAVCRSLRRSDAELRVTQADATSVVLGGEPPDLVFVDPPYELIPDVAPKLFEKLAMVLASHSDPLVIFEMPGELTLSPEGWTCVKRLGQGMRQPTVCIFRTNRALI